MINVVSIAESSLKHHRDIFDEKSSHLCVSMKHNESPMTEVEGKESLEKPNLTKLINFNNFKN